MSDAELISRITMAEEEFLPQVPNYEDKRPHLRADFLNEVTRVTRRIAALLSNGSL